MLGVNPSSFLQKQKPKGPTSPLEDKGCCGIFFPMQQQGIKFCVFQMEGSRNSSTSSLNVGCFLQISIWSLHSPSHLTPLSTYALTVYCHSTQRSHLHCSLASIITSSLFFVPYPPSGNICLPFLKTGKQSNKPLKSKRHCP